MQSSERTQPDDSRDGDQYKINEQQKTCKIFAIVTENGVNAN